MQEETWANNANAFVQQEDDATSYSVRVAGFDFLGVDSFLFFFTRYALTQIQFLADRNSQQTTRVFQLVVRQVIQSSQQQREAGRQDWYALNHSDHVNYLFHSRSGGDL